MSNCPGLSKVVKDALFTLIAKAQPERKLILMDKLRRLATKYISALTHEKFGAVANLANSHYAEKTEVLLS